MQKRLIVAAIVIHAAIFAIPHAGFLADQPTEARVLASAPEPDPAVADPSVLDEFGGYRLTNLTMPEAQRIYDSLPYENLLNSFEKRCGDRAYVWSYLMKQNFGVDSGKIFMYFTGNATNPMLWTFHVASYVVIDGQEYVVEKIPDIKVGGGYRLLDHLMFPGPVPIRDWMARHAGGDCRVLSKNEPADLPYLRQFNQTGNRIAHPSEKCFIRKTPMNYWWNTAAYNQAIKGIEAPAMTRSSAVSACSSAVNVEKRGFLGKKKERAEAFAKCNAMLP